MCNDATITGTFQVAACPRPREALNWKTGFDPCIVATLRKSSQSSESATPLDHPIRLDPRPQAKARLDPRLAFVKHRTDKYVYLYDNEF